MKDHIIIFIFKLKKKPLSPWKISVFSVKRLIINLNNKGMHLK